MHPGDNSVQKGKDWMFIWMQLPLFSQSQGKIGMATYDAIPEHVFCMIVWKHSSVCVLLRLFFHPSPPFFCQDVIHINSVFVRPIWECREFVSQRHCLALTRVYFSSDCLGLAKHARRRGRWFHESRIQRHFSMWPSAYFWPSSFLMPRKTLGGLTHSIVSMWRAWWRSPSWKGCLGRGWSFRWREVWIRIYSICKVWSPLLHHHRHHQRPRKKSLETTLRWIESRWHGKNETGEPCSHSYYENRSNVAMRWLPLPFCGLQKCDDQGRRKSRLGCRQRAADVLLSGLAVIPSPWHPAAHDWARERSRTG